MKLFKMGLRLLSMLFNKLNQTLPSITPFDNSFDGGKLWSTPVELRDTGLTVATTMPLAMTCMVCGAHNQLGNERHQPVSHYQHFTRWVGLVEDRIGAI